MMRFAFIIAVLIFSQQSFAKNAAIVFGGACEYDDVNATKPQVQNQFFKSMQLVSKVLNKQNWNIEIYFSGKTRNCEIDTYDPICRANPSDVRCCPERIDRESWGKEFFLEGMESVPIVDATKENLFKALDRASRDLQKDDQLLVYINTHGTKSSDSATHAICVEGTTSEERKLAMNDPALMSRLTILKSAGVRLAFVEDTCFSGGSIPILGQFGCALTSQHASFETVSGDYSTMAWQTRTLFGSKIQPVNGAEKSFDDLYLLSLVGPRFNGNGFSNFPQLSSYSSDLTSSVDFAFNMNNNAPFGTGENFIQRTVSATFVYEYLNLKVSPVEAFKKWGIDKKAASFFLLNAEDKNKTIANSYINRLNEFSERIDIFNLVNNVESNLGKIDQQVKLLNEQYKLLDDQYDKIRKFESAGNTTMDELQSLRETTLKGEQQARSMESSLSTLQESSYFIYMSLKVIDFVMTQKNSDNSCSSFFF